ncbi:hypothetical protein MKW98_019782 [Papaver atlanticum]|uniref:TF-B3 domain-containing protein n=1 Tax=Papaver atlanticum TaxID=357466 RepID=A0AAD4TCJ9_9MAGN|nr:hypothetical protein MKW98_019782 [Papaver atlanticum]
MANVNSYEEARKQRLEENRRRFQDLGVDKIVKSLTPVANPKPKAKPKSTTAAPVDPDLVRRSSRPRNSATSYAEEFIKDRPQRKKLRSGTSTRIRKAHEKVATAAQRANAIKRAEDFRVQHVPSSHPSYVKSMLQSHVYHGFWLNVPNDFCQKYLTEEKLTIVLEDEEGVEYDTIYIGEKTGLSGGWKAFSKDHKLDDGDALVFELIKPTRFKVHIFKGIIDGVGEANTKKPKKGNRNKPIKKVKNSDAEEEDMVEEVAEQIAKPRERQTRNSKKAGDDF